MRRLSRVFVHILSLVSMVLIFIMPISGFALCESDVDVARSALGSAEEALASAYFAVLEAERAGGDVSELVSYLRIAAKHLSEAEMALESGDYDGASLLAEEAGEAAKKILIDTSRLGNLAQIQGRTAFGYRLFFSFGGVILILLFGFFGWMRFRDYYVRRLMGLRPEVSADES
jgi:hypothetical protein